MHMAIHRGTLTETQLDFYDREGYIVLENLLNDDDLQPAREAMQHKVDLIADDLYANGLITDKREDAPFAARLARPARSDARLRRTCPVR